MRILLASARPLFRSGTPMFIRDISRTLQELGHTVMAWGFTPSQESPPCPDDDFPRVTDLARLPFKPDIIHAQHHLEAMAALAALPDVPAVFHCHSAVWHGCPPRHPRILHHLAMSRTLAERLSVEFNIAPSDITVLLNPVDLGRFSVVRAPAARPARALFFNSRHQEQGATVKTIRAATARCGLALDFLGAPFTDPVEKPETILPSYDIVFASGRSAIEALASGCAVVVLGTTSCGGMVRTGNFERFRTVNFSIAANSPPPSVEHLVEELEGYDASDVAAVTERLRREADINGAARQLVSIYECVAERQRSLAPDLPGEILALSRYLDRIAPLIMTSDAMLNRHWMSPERATTVDELSVRLCHAEHRLGILEASGSSPAEPCVCIPANSPSPAAED
jgi:hypothetical protein